MPVELNKKELFRRGITGEEIILYGRIPTMISSQCINQTKDKCQAYNKATLSSIKDRKGQKLPVCFDCCSCTNIIYNSVPSCLFGERDFVRKMCPSSLRVDFIDENIESIRNIMGYVYDFIEGKSVDISSNDFKFTKGHINRGVE